VATLVIAVVGLALAAVSLAWQAASFFLSGPRVRVSLEEALRLPATGALMVGPLEIYTDAGRNQLDDDGYTQHVLVVSAGNRGRMGADVTGWAIIFGNGARWTHPGFLGNPRLPYRLEPFTNVMWCAAVADLEAVQAAFTDQREDAAKARAIVEIAGDRMSASRSTVVVRPGQDAGDSSWPSYASAYRTPLAAS
jgi:hypothetical protein